MSINEDYAGGSYKSNGELETDIENLTNRVSGLEAEISELKELILQMVELGPMNDKEVQGWEVASVLAKWVSGDRE